MKSCDYCGRENEDVSVFCAECGTQFQQPIADRPPSPSSKTPRVLNAKYATIIFIVTFAAMIPATILVVLIGFYFLGMDSEPHAFFRAILPPMLLFQQICSIAALVWATTAFEFRRDDRSPTGTAWVRGSWRAIAGGAFTGAVIFFITGLILVWAGPSHSSHGTSYLEQMSRTPGLQQIAWIMNGVLFAPVIEELLFRGVLYGGYRRSFGHGWATVITTSIFILMHFPNLAYRPIDVIDLAGLALAAIWWRLRSSAIGPCVAIHFAYNALVTLEHVWWTYRH